MSLLLLLLLAGESLKEFLLLSLWPAELLDVEHWEMQKNNSSEVELEDVRKARLSTQVGLHDEEQSKMECCNSLEMDLCFIVEMQQSDIPYFSGHSEKDLVT